MNVRYLYFLSFIEGASVMSAELMGAKLLAPYFGTSLYVWAAALGLTLGGLMSGYFLGGITSRKFPDKLNVLYYVLLGAAIFLFFMPFTSKWIMGNTLSFGLQGGAVVSLLIFMVPPLLLMGMVSPLIINFLTKDAQGAGNSAGNVYAISTLGGIIATFLLGFYVIPEFGITWPAMINGLFLGAFPLVSLLRNQRWEASMAGLLLIPVFFYQLNVKEHAAEGLHYFSEGVMGQVKVIDLDLSEQRSGRALVVNNTLQTVYDPHDPGYDFWKYTHYIPELAARFSSGDSVLLLGMGGGTLVRRLDAKGFDMDIVEIDERIVDAAIAHFGLSPDYNIIVDDARHFLKVASRTYEVIVYDTFKGESAPEHLITLEGLEDAKAVLAEDGLLLINFYGYAKGDLGKIMRSIAKTLAASGFQVFPVATPGAPDVRNIILMAAADGTAHDYEEAIAGLGLRPLQVNTSDAVILTDEAPQTRMYARVAAQWRLLYNKYYTRQFSKY